MALIIITDSSADYEPEELSAQNISLVPLSVTFGEESFLDGVNLTKDDFYRKLKMGGFPTTSQPPPGAFLPIFNKAKQNGDDVLAILISSSLSGTVQSALLAKEICEYDKITVIDSLTTVTGLRLLVNIAVKMRDENIPLAAIAQKIEELTAKIRIFASVNTLDYLHKGGRLTKTQATVGNMLKLKPLIAVNKKGEVVLWAKCLGLNKAINRLIKALEDYPPDFNYPILLPFASDNANCLKLAKAAKELYPPIDASNAVNIGPTIGAHVGPNAFGITYIQA